MHHARILISLSTLTLVLACSSSPSPSPSPGGGTASPTPTIAPTASATPVPVGNSTSPGPTTTPPGIGTDGGGTCASSASYDACEQCCEAKFPAGATAAQAAVAKWQQCACTKCAAQCASSACSANETDPTPECQTCFDNATDCDAQYEQACNQDPNCAAIDQCMQSSQCEDKQ